MNEQASVDFHQRVARKRCSSLAVNELRKSPTDSQDVRYRIAQAKWDRRLYPGRNSESQGAAAFARVRASDESSGISIEDNCVSAAEALPSSADDPMAAA